MPLANNSKCNGYEDARRFKNALNIYHLHYPFPIVKYLLVIAGDFLQTTAMQSIKK